MKQMIKNFKKFNEGLQDDLDKIEGDMSQTFKFSVEKSGFDPDWGEEITLIDFRTGDDWVEFSESFPIAKESPASMILIKNYRGEIKKYSVCDIHKSQIESWIDSGNLTKYDDSFIIGFQLDLGGGDIEDYLINSRPDDEEGDYEEYDFNNRRISRHCGCS